LCYYIVLPEQNIKKSDIESTEKKRGGQPRNQNARIHGFYSRVLTLQQKKLEMARRLNWRDITFGILGVISQKRKTNAVLGLCLREGIRFLKKAYFLTLNC
jgi:hypothetical protein